MDIDSQRTAAEEARVKASEMTCEALSQLRRSIQVSKGKDSKQLSDCDRSAVLFASDFRRRSTQAVKNAIDSYRQTIKT